MWKIFSFSLALRRAGRVRLRCTPSWRGVRGVFPALKPLGRSAFQALSVVFQPRAASRGLVAALGRSGLEIGGRPSQCGPYREPDLSWAVLRFFGDLGTACGFFGQKLRISGFFGRISVDFVAVRGVFLLLSLEF